jgi:3-methyladenine DNA glycosylase/8-oxoguanine DNA glycosylase
MELYLPAQPPFSFPAVVRSHGWVQMQPFRSNGDYTWLGTTIQLDTGRVVDLGLSQAGNGVRVLVDQELEETEKRQAAEMVTWMLNLDRDFSEFYRHAQREPKLAHVQDNAMGRVLRSPSLFEDVIKTILTTNTAWGGTLRMNRSLVEQFGQPLPEDGSRRTFPSPQAVAGSDVDTLRNVTKLGYRAPYVLELARRVSDGVLDLESYRSSQLATSDLRKELLAIKGIGGYAAANLLMILGRSDFIPIDSWAMKMVSQEWYNGEPVSPPQVEAAFADWGPWKGLAYWFWKWDNPG